VRKRAVRWVRRSKGKNWWREGTEKEAQVEVSPLLQSSTYNRIACKSSPAAIQRKLVTPVTWISANLFLCCLYRSYSDSIRHMRQEFEKGDDKPLLSEDLEAARVGVMDFSLLITIDPTPPCSNTSILFDLQARRTVEVAMFPIQQMPIVGPIPWRVSATRGPFFNHTAHSRNAVTQSFASTNDSGHHFVWTCQLDLVSSLFHLANAASAACLIVPAEVLCEQLDRQWHHEQDPAPARQCVNRLRLPKWEGACAGISIGSSFEYAITCRLKSRKFVHKHFVGY